MSFKATINLDELGEEINLLKVFHSIYQGVDSHGKPATDVISGEITIIVDGHIGDKFIDWLIDPFAKQSGKIAYYKDDGSKFRDLEFQDAQILNYIELFNPDLSFLIGGDSTLYDSSFNLHKNIMYKYFGTTFEDSWEYQKRTKIPYCIAICFHAAKITMNGMDHDNNWG